MTAPERFADSQIPLAPRAPSIHDPSRRFATANYRIAKGSFALDVGCLTQATFAERPCCRILQGFPEIKTDRLNCGQALSAIDVWSTTMMIGKMV